MSAPTTNKTNTKATPAKETAKPVDTSSELVELAPDDVVDKTEVPVVRVPEILSVTRFLLSFAISIL